MVTLPCFWVCNPKSHQGSATIFPFSINPNRQFQASFYQTSTRGPFHYGPGLSSGEANVNGLRPYGNAEVGVNRPHTMPVGSFKPNAFGLFDMHGNVWEWCDDPYMKYADKLQRVFPDLQKTTNRVLRGGSYFFAGADCRSAKRSFRHPANAESFTGFRVACDLVGAVEKK